MNNIAPSLLGDIKRGVADFRFPDLSHRVTINGRTGSGKTVAASWLLSRAQFDKQPFIIVDFKGEKLFSRIEKRIELSLKDKLPTRPGIYHIKLLPTDETENENWLWKIWKHTKIGLFIDEGYLLPHDGRSKAYKAIMTTGRSRELPTYTLSQRPVGLPRHTFSEQDFYMCFDVNDDRDLDTISQWTPKDGIWADMDTNLLPEFNSRWYEIGRRYSCILSPCPDEEKILETFDHRLTPRKRMI